MITIAIPTYKRPKYLDEAIKSAINQYGFTNKYKIIVVNNDPDTDMREYEEKYEDYNIDFYTNEMNLGMIGNIRRCIELTTTKYIAFLHDDDLLCPDYLMTIEKYLNNTNCDCIIPSRYLLFDKPYHCKNQFKKRIKELIVSLYLPRYFNKKNFYTVNIEDNIYSWQNCYCAPTCGVVFKKELLYDEELWDISGTLAWDFLLFLRFNKKHKVGKIDDVLSYYRVSSGVSNKESTKIDFYNSYDLLKKEYQNHHFVKKYSQEIDYLNSKLLLNKDTRIIKYNKIKYLLFSIKRIFYYSYNHLDVEKMPNLFSRKGGYKV